jgi:hypothetical protein
MRPISAPWLLRFRRRELEVRLLAQGEPGDDAELAWTHALGGESAAVPPTDCRTTRFGPDVVLLRFRIADYACAGLIYRVRCGRYRSLPMRVPPDPGPGQVWRFLVTSDHQGMRGVRRTVEAVDRMARAAPFHGVLFAGDLASIPDERGAWCGGPEGLAFFDTMAAPVEAIFRDDGAASAEAGGEKLSGRGVPAAGEAHPGWPVLSTTPIYACPGNHDVSCAEPRGATAAERFEAVTPDCWDIATFSALMLPVGAAHGPEAPPGCYAAEIGPLRILALFVANRWVRGDHERLTGPCYEPPGRFIFESIEPGSRQLGWLAGQVREPESVAGAAADRAGTARAAALRVALLHHPPYAQGFNALPVFGHPLAYEVNLIDRHVVPLIEPWAQLVLSGHNHAVNHHVIRGVHYYESSHMGAGKEPFAFGADGYPAREPMGHPGSFFLGQSEESYFSVLETFAGPGPVRARMELYRALPGGSSEPAYAFTL